MKKIIIVFILVFASFLMGNNVDNNSISSLNSSCCKVCKDSCACGDSCISCDKTCHQGPGCACNADSGGCG